MTIYYQESFQRGFGTWPLRGNDLRAAMEQALKAGYRAFDTAQMYGNEAEVGETLSTSGVPRNELCITTKVHPDNFSTDRFLPSVEASLNALQLDCVDVLLLHWPAGDGKNTVALENLAAARDAGMARFVGVSNYTIEMLAQACTILGHPPVTNQVEFHPLLDQSRLLDGANSLGVPLASYCSVARGAIFQRPELAEIGASYSKSAAQVALRWILQQGVSLNTMSTKAENIKANFDIMDFVLSNVDMARVSALADPNGRIVTSEVVPWAPDWD